MEQAAVNRKVGGSNPLSGAKEKERDKWSCFFCCDLAAALKELASEWER